MLIKGKLKFSFYGTGYYVFLVEFKEERYLVFRIIAYFYGTRDL